MTPMRKLFPFLVATGLKGKLGPNYEASKMSSGDLLLELKDKYQVRKSLPALVTQT